MSDAEKQEITGVLEDWKVIPILGRKVLLGYIYGDSKGRFEDGTIVRTSLLTGKTTDLKKGGIVTTLNSVYKLGNKLKGKEAENA